MQQTKVIWAPATSIHELEYVLQDMFTNKIIAYKLIIFQVFIAFFSSLSTKRNLHHNCHNHDRRRWKWPHSTPHEALCSMSML